MAHKNCVCTMKYLTQCFNFYFTDVHKRSALSYAVYEGSLSMVYYLLLYGSDANHIDNWGLSPVQCAAFTGNFYIFKLLVQFGRADRNIKSRQVVIICCKL